MGQNGMGIMRRILAVEQRLNEPLHYLRPAGNGVREVKPTHTNPLCRISRG